MKKLLAKGLVAACAALMLTSACQSSPGTAAPAGSTGATFSSPAAMPSITIYHLEGRRSERIVWLMEELNLPYTLVFTRGDLTKSMAAIRAVNPGMPVAPTVTIGNEVMTESGAIIETIINRYAPGKLTPALNSPDYGQHMIWMHHAEGSLASRVIADYRVWMIKPPTARSPLVDSEAEVQFAEDYLAKHPWFGGDEFTAADIMMVFPLNFAMQLNIVDKTRFPKINAWKAKIEQRPAYQRMLVKARPDGMVGSLTPLPQHAPSGPRTPAPAAAAPAPARPAQ
jgi:glutathione S-transferase